MAKRCNREFERHGPPVTRRDFLARGLMSSFTVFLPSLLPPLLRAQGAECARPEFSAGIPFFCVDGAGGMNIAGGNVMVGMQATGGQLAFGPNSADYLRLGLPAELHPKNAGMIETIGGGLAFHTTSGILRGMKSVFGPMESPTILAKMDGMLLLTRTFDDTGNNPLNTSYLAQKAGAQGQLVQLVGTRNSASGGNSLAPIGSVSASLTPSTVGRRDDAMGLVSLGNTLMGNNYLGADGGQGQENVRKFLERVANLSDVKTNGSGLTGEIQTLLKCANNDVIEMLQHYSAAVLDPAGDQAVTDAFGDDRNGGAAAITKLVTDSYAGAGTITIGGCDYHNGTNAAGDAKDEEIGVLIGRIVKVAATKNKPAIIHLFTDGGVTGSSSGVVDDDNGKVIWTSDSGTRSASLLLVFKPDHQPNDEPLVKTSHRQIGHYNPGGGVNEQSSYIGASAENMTEVVALNYLAALGRLDNARELLGIEPNPKALELVGFRKIV